MNRKKFIQNFGISGAIIVSQPIITKANVLQAEPQLNKELVSTFVGAGHTDMDKVKALLEETPNLLNAAHDWKYGDFETCLGAASHVGYKELAVYLLEKGAQANIFTACLFGKIEIVRPTLEAFPSVLHAKGPHGFTLLHHANRGEEEALEVKEFLVSLGARETKVPLY